MMVEKVLGSRKISLICTLAIYSSLTMGRDQSDAPWVGSDLDGITCSRVKPGGFGPFDYSIQEERDAPLGGGALSRIEAVERHHFTPESENLIKFSHGSFRADYAYTLRAFPNHHRALLSLIRHDLEVRNKIREAPPGDLPPAECFFQRAINFSPNDWVPYSLFGYYLRKLGKFGKAKSLYASALTIAPNEAKLEYSYSLLLIEMKLYDEAYQHAKKAYEIGNPPDGLKKQLQVLGIWK